jgi:hypothetical protein
VAVGNAAERSKKLTRIFKIMVFFIYQQAHSLAGKYLAWCRTSGATVRSAMTPETGALMLALASFSP